MPLVPLGSDCRESWVACQLLQGRWVLCSVTTVLSLSSKLLQDKSLGSLKFPNWDLPGWLSVDSVFCSLLPLLVASSIWTSNTHRPILKMPSGLEEAKLRRDKWQKRVDTSRNAFRGHCAKSCPQSYGLHDSALSFDVQEKTVHLLYIIYVYDYVTWLM